MGQEEADVNSAFLILDVRCFAHAFGHRDEQPWRRRPHAGRPSGDSQDAKAMRTMEDWTPLSRRQFIRNGDIENEADGDEYCRLVDPANE